uniref:Transposable element P transposase-like RNase H C-terminal domain-containing protein n=1 Tax=Anopheles albimanus TaxID=7167 RepID=A0A182FWF1_ANOAL
MDYKKSFNANENQISAMSDMYESILNMRLNQDVLENFFSQIRQIGGVHDHPSPIRCLYRIRLLMLGKSSIVLLNQTSNNPAVGIERNTVLEQ